MKRWIGFVGAWLGARAVLPIDEIEALCFIPDLGVEGRGAEAVGGWLDAQ